MLPRAGIRTLRSLQSQTPRVYIPARAYAKVGKPKPTEFKHVASNVATPKKDNTYKQGDPIKFSSIGKSSKISTTAPSASQIASESSSSSNAQARSSAPKSQSELDQEAIDALPKTEESKSKQAIGSQADSEEPSTEGQIPLHDITRGIPSTLDAELREAERRQRQADGEEVEEEPVRPAAGAGGKGDRPVRDYTTSAERRRNRMLRWVVLSLGLLAVTGPIYLGRNWESEEEAKAHPDAPNGYTPGKIIDRVRARTSTTLDYYNEPAFPKLLPDVDPQFERPYTLVLSLEDLLIHGEWTREHGWRIAKRPGLDYFLRYLQSYYELVIFTSAPSMVGAPVLMKLDPFGIIPWRLFREATRYKDGKYIKDLSFLNRPLDKIILLDTDSSHAEAQPENSIIIPKWTGDPNDKELIALIPFLEYTAAMGYPDTRKVLASFKDKHIPTEFAARESQARKLWNERLASEKKSRRGGISSLSSALGIKADPQQQQIPGVTTLSEGLAKGMMLHDIIREQGQKQYEAFDKQIRDNQDAWLADIKKEEEKMRAESMTQMKQSAFGWFGAKGEQTRQEIALGEKQAAEVAALQK